MQTLGPRRLRWKGQSTLFVSAMNLLCTFISVEQSWANKHSQTVRIHACLVPNQYIEMMYAAVYLRCAFYAKKSQVLWKKNRYKFQWRTKWIVIYRLARRKITYVLDTFYAHSWFARDEENRFSTNLQNKVFLHLLHTYFYVSPTASLRLSSFPFAFNVYRLLSINIK